MYSTQSRNILHPGKAHKTTSTCWNENNEANDEKVNKIVENHKKVNSLRISDQLIQYSLYHLLVDLIHGMKKPE